jgi:hypothetical protein
MSIEWSKAIGAYIYFNNGYFSQQEGSRKHYSEIAGGEVDRLRKHRWSSFLSFSLGWKGAMRGGVFDFDEVPNGLV